MKKLKSILFVLLVFWTSASISAQFNQSNVATGIYSFPNRNTPNPNNNCAYGFSTLSQNTDGDNNIAIGYTAANGLTTGDDNVAIGSWTLNGNVTGNENVAVGSGSMLYTGPSISRNAAFGFESLWRVANNDNNAFGYQSMRMNGSGTQNAGFGTQVLRENLVGSYNAAFGNYALQKNLSNGNSAFGYNAANLTKTGSGNSVFGANAFTNNVAGHINTAVGTQSLQYALNSYNTAMGAYAGLSAAYADGCTFLGYNADVTDYNLAYNNSTAIGNNARITASNQVVVGNVGVASIGGFTNWTSFSDGRFKKDISEKVPGLEFINKLRPVTYHLDAQGIAKYLGEDPLDSLNASVYPDMLTAANLARDAKSQQLETGFIAQEVADAAKAVGFDFSGVDQPQNDQDLYGLRYAAFTVPLVKAVQELDQQNQALKARSRQLEAENHLLKTQQEAILKRLDAMEAVQAERQHTLTAPALLKQNIPNPFSGSTTIDLSVPAHATRAILRVSHESGAVVQEITIAERGEVSMAFTSGTLGTGVYFYSLIVDGKTIDTKKMVLVH
jgi:trimeric autotransporter adhesin